MSRWRFALPLVVFGLLSLTLGRGLRLDPHELPSPLIDKPAPAFALTRLEDASRTVRPQDMLGKVWILNVWASWCETCREEQPELLAFARTRSVAIVGLDYKDTRAQAQGWLARFGDPYTATLFDEDGRVGIDYGVYGVPETFVIDKQGVVRLKIVGPLSRTSIDTRILPMLKDLDV